LTGLSPSTTYYYRAKAVNSAGTGYGSEMSFATVSSTSEIAPTIVSIYSSVPSGTYGESETINISVLFSEAISSSGNITVELETGDNDRTCTFTMTNANAGSCDYVVQSGDASSDLTVKSISGVAVDVDNNNLDATIPGGYNLADGKDIIIDTVGATIEELDAIADAISVPVLKKVGSDDKKTFLSYFKSNKEIELSSKTAELAGGLVKILVGDKTIKEAEVKDNGKWKTRLKFKKTTKIKIIYYDSRGNEIKKKSYEIHIDSEKPKLTGLPTFILYKHRGESIWWRASDNKGIDHYKYELNGRIFYTHDELFILPENMAVGLHLVKISAYDRAGNKTTKSVSVFIRP
jgi:hypothetical protein